MVFDYDQPCYAISVVARIVGVHAQTLRAYEREGLVKPSRSRGNVRLYSQRDVEQLQKIKEWMEHWGVNLAGVQVIADLLSQIAAQERRIAELTAELEALRRNGGATGRADYEGSGRTA